MYCDGAPLEPLKPLEPHGVRSVRRFVANDGSEHASMYACAVHNVVACLGAQVPPATAQALAQDPELQLAFSALSTVIELECGNVE